MIIKITIYYKNNTYFDIVKYLYIEAKDLKEILYNYNLKELCITYKQKKEIIENVRDYKIKEIGG